ncbi:MAG: gamma-glutamylcyclotransferase family protein, partial [Solirubrobacteraceae bacterium]
GYKYYRDPSGERPPIFVTFLNLVPAAGRNVNGIVFRVDPHELEGLDQRERNYTRREVTEHVSENVDGRVWAYVGSPDAERRFSTGMQTGRAAVSRAYIDHVLDGFRNVGEGALGEFEATTAPPECPVLELERVDMD